MEYATCKRVGFPQRQTGETMLAHHRTHLPSDHTPTAQHLACARPRKHHPPHLLQAATQRTAATSTAATARRGQCP